MRAYSFCGSDFMKWAVKGSRDFGRYNSLFNDLTLDYVLKKNFDVNHFDNVVGVGVRFFNSESFKPNVNSVVERHDYFLRPSVELVSEGEFRDYVAKGLFPFKSKMVMSKNYFSSSSFTLADLLSSFKSGNMVRSKVVHKDVQIGFRRENSRKVYYLNIDEHVGDFVYLLSSSNYDKISDLLKK